MLRSRIALLYLLFVPFAVHGQCDGPGCVRAPYVGYQAMPHPPGYG